MNLFIANVREVLRVAFPLLVSTGMFSLVLFTDRTFLLWYDGQAMSASMTGGNLFWVSICLPVGIASMASAIIAQYVGSHQEQQVGKILWQTLWLGLASAPWLGAVGYFAPELFRLTEQPAELIQYETLYLRVLLFGGVGMIFESGLSSFFSGTERTTVIMYTSVCSALLNIALDYWFIFGGAGLEPHGIAGAAIASDVAFWFKAIVYAVILTRHQYQFRYKVLSSYAFNGKLFGRLIYFGFPAGLHAVLESGSFSWIILQIGRLGDIPLRATTMAISFNLIAFIPLVGLQIATSVLVGRHLTESGPESASRVVRAALCMGLLYCALWGAVFVIFPDFLLSIYSWGGQAEGSVIAADQAKKLLLIVTAYLFLDAIQVIFSGALRGAGDTWFVLFTICLMSVLCIGGATLLQPILIPRFSINPLHYWWFAMCAWVWGLGTILTLRYRNGRWKNMRMIDAAPSHRASAPIPLDEARHGIKT